MTVGTLFTEDFLAEGIKQSTAWKDLASGEVEALRKQVGAVFGNDPNLPEATLLRNASRGT